MICLKHVEFRSSILSKFPLRKDKEMVLLFANKQLQKNKPRTKSKLDCVHAQTDYDDKAKHLKKKGQEAPRRKIRKSDTSLISVSLSISYYCHHLLPFSFQTCTHKPNTSVRKIPLCSRLSPLYPCCRQSPS